MNKTREGKRNDLAKAKDTQHRWWQQQQPTWPETEQTEPKLGLMWQWTKTYGLSSHGATEVQCQSPSHHATPMMTTLGEHNEPLACSVVTENPQWPLPPKYREHSIHGKHSKYVNSSYQLKDSMANTPYRQNHVQLIISCKTKEHAMSLVFTMHYIPQTRCPYHSEKSNEKGFITAWTKPKKLSFHDYHSIPSNRQDGLQGNWLRYANQSVIELKPIIKQHENTSSSRNCMSSNMFK